MDDRALGLAETIEPLAALVWPARETLTVDGWLVRLTDGYSHRANSVLPAAFDGEKNLDAAIDTAERIFQARGLPPMFHMSPVARPAALETALIARGYALVSATHVCVARAFDASSGSIAGTIHCNAGDARFNALVVAGSRSAGDGCERLEVLARLTQPHARILALDEGQVVACGFGVLVDGWAAIGLMRSAEGHRRRGHAGRVLSAIAAWAGESGIKNLFLQVEDDNGPARALYKKAGFVPAYPYRCYRKA